MEQSPNPVVSPNHASRFAVGVAIFLALMALLVSVWQGVETRRYFRTSMEPHLDLFLTPEFGEQFGVFFDNAGAGPARILGYTITIGGSEYTEQDLSSGRWEKENPLEGLRITSAWLQPGDSIVVGRHREILTIPKESPVELYERFFKILKTTEIRIEYESYFGDQFLGVWEWEG